MSNPKKTSMSEDMRYGVLPQVREIPLINRTTRLAMLAVVGVLTGLAVMMFFDAPARAEALCGGLDKKGNLQQSCQGRPAKYEGKPSTTCPSGQFYDLEACWSCPSGYSRSGDGVTTDTACHKITSKDVFNDAVPAQLLEGVSQCPPGSFFDLYNGGTCWRCPSGYNRTLFDPINSDKACERVTGLLQFSWQKAQFKGPECGDSNAVFDLIDGGTCWSCPDGYVRTINSVKSGQACGRPVFETAAAQKKGEAGCQQYGSNAFWDPKNFGSCYSCPAGYTRSEESVDSPRGCLAPSIEWKMAPYEAKGFIEMDGAIDVVLKLINERSELERIAVNMGRIEGMDRTRSIEALWQEVAQFPEESLALRYAVLNHLIEAVMSGSVAASSPEGRLIREIEKFANGYRVYLATEAVKAYDVWHAAQTLKLKEKQTADSKAGRSNLQFLFSDQLPVPPNFEQITNRAAMVNTVAAVPTLGMFSTALIPYQDGSVADEIIRRSYPNRTKIDIPDVNEISNLEDKMKLIDNVDDIVGSGDDVAKVAGRVGQEIGEQADDAVRAAAKAGLKLSKKLVSKMLAVSGPQIVVELAVAIFEAELNKNLAKADARPALMRALEHAKSYKPSLKVWLQNKDEAKKVYSYWALAASNEVRPSASDLKKIEAAAMGHYAESRFSADPLYFVYNEGKWHNFDGGATAISAGPSGDVWHVGGGHVYWADPVNDNTWSEIGGGNNVVDIAAMPARKEAFALFEGGAMKAYDGRSWHNVPGIGHAVDVGPDGRKWHIGGSNSLYVSGPDDFRWQRVNGPKVKKISAGRGGMLWVVDTNDKLHYLLNGNWKDFGRTAKDVAVSPDGAVWITSLEDEVFRLSYNGQWKAGHGGTISQVDAGPSGTLWALRPDNAIVLYRHSSTPRPKMAATGMLSDSTKISKRTDVDEDEILLESYYVVDTPVVTTYTMNGPKNWRNVGGRASQVSIGQSGDVWHIGGNGSLYINPQGRSTWKQVLESGVARVEAGRLKNNAFILTSDGKMWNIDSLGKKTQISGWASDIAVDDAGTQWHVGGNGSIYRMGGNGWVQVPGNVSRIAAGANGEVWSVGRKGEIYRLANGQWNQIPGSARDVAVGRDGSVWHLGGPNGNVLYKWNAKDENWEGIDETRAQTVSIGPDGDVWVARPDGSMTAYD